MAGRPSKMTADVLEKLEQAFAMGHTDEEACILAGINPTTLYTYCKHHKNFSSKKELLKNTPKLNARRNIVMKINEGDVDLSKWFLERKAKEEFSTKKEVDNTVSLSQADKLDQIGMNLRSILDNRAKSTNM